MNDSPVPDLAEAERIDALCDRFEDAWRAGPPPPLEGFLNTYQGPARAELFRELLRIEIVYRQQAGEPLTTEEYLRRFPELADIVHTVVRGTTQDVADTSDDIEPPTRVLIRPTKASFEMPKQFGRYEIVQALEPTERHAVYLAHDPQMDRNLLLEVLRFGEGDGRAAVRRFLRAARAAAGLHHPNLCPVLDAGEIAGIPYLTRPRLDGPTLAERLRGANVPPPGSSCGGEAGAWSARGARAGRTPPGPDSSVCASDRRKRAGADGI